FFMTHIVPLPTLTFFPYTTLFRSPGHGELYRAPRRTAVGAAAECSARGTEPCSYLAYRSCRGRAGSTSERAHFRSDSASYCGAGPAHRRRAGLPGPFGDPAAGPQLAYPECAAITSREIWAEQSRGGKRGAAQCETPGAELCTKHGNRVDRG